MALDSAHGLPPFPRQPPGLPWPTRDWPLSVPAGGVDEETLTRTMSFAFSDESRGEIGETRALLAIHQGVLVAERYAPDLAPESTLPSWSMAKSVLHAVVGTLVRDERLMLHERVAVPQWLPGDPRGGITLDELLRMSSGLAFREEYVDGTQSDVIPMLFAEGKDDVARYAATFPLEHAPGTFWSYSSGSSNIVSGVVARTLGGEAEYREYMLHELFERIGMRSAQPRFDAAGTWIGSSFVFATARDFARFGLLYLRGGVWEDEQLLPTGWIDYARTPAPACATREYGAHWWIVEERPDVFYASGYEGQRIVVAPAHDLVLVRSARSRIQQRDAIRAFMLGLIDAFPFAQSTS